MVTLSYHNKYMRWGPLLPLFNETTYRPEWSTCIKQKFQLPWPMNSFSHFKWAVDSHISLSHCAFDKGGTLLLCIKQGLAITEEQRPLFLP